MRCLTVTASIEENIQINDSHTSRCNNNNRHCDHFLRSRFESSAVGHNRGESGEKYFVCFSLSLSPFISIPLLCELANVLLEIHSFLVTNKLNGLCVQAHSMPISFLMRDMTSQSIICTAQ